MRIAITGASGFVGPQLLNGLARAGHSGYAIARREVRDLPPAWIWLSRECALSGGEFAKGGLPSPDWVIHLEVQHHVDAPTANDVAEFQKVNVDATRAWLQWCVRVGVKRFALFSSIKAVGQSRQCQDEFANTPPSGPYGKSKRHAEELVRSWAAESADRTALILRPAVIYGPANQANILAMVRAIDRGMFLLVGRNDNVKSIVSAKNLIAAVVHLICIASPGLALYNVVDLESYTVRDLADMMSRALGKERPPRSLPVLIARVAAAVCDSLKRVTGRSMPLTNSRLSALLETSHFTNHKLLSTGFIHPQSTEQGLEEMITWYRRTGAVAPEERRH